MSFQRQRRVRFQDCDPAGIVFYPRYIEMLTDVLEEWSTRHLDDGQASAAALLPVAADIRFLRPSRLGDTLSFVLTLLERSSESLTFDCSIDSDDEQRVRMRLSLGCFQPGPPVERIPLRYK